MVDKFKIYELLSWVIPGTLLLCLVAVSFPSLAAACSEVKFPDAFSVIALLALAIFVGNLVQAVASLIEPVLDWTWGGRPSERALRDGLGNRYLPKDSAERIRKKLEAALGVGASDRAIFLYAMQRAESAGSDRIGTFNALYAYHRALLVLSFAGLLALIIAVVSGHLPDLPWYGALGVIASGAVGLALVWHRTKQRAFYYVREVLHTAERLLDEAAPKSSDVAAH
jgi:hypothetical protein